MKRFNVLYTIMHFGRDEEKQLIAESKRHEAYQIEHARDTLIYRFSESSIKNTLNTLNLMIEYEIDNNGVWQYHPTLFVHDEFTRNLLIDLRKKLERK